MVVRESFESSLKELEEKIVEMERQTIVMLEKAFSSLKTQDIEGALRVLEEDDEVDDLEEEINRLALWLMVKEQPVARDLRMIIGAIKISSEVERIADFAVNIAKATLQIGKSDSKANTAKLEEILGICLSMLQKSLKAFFEGEMSLAKEVGDMDDKVDELSDLVYRELTSYLSEHPEETNHVVQLLFVNRHLERVGDHITNIAESAAYLIKGRIYDLNP
ncbi:phosphate signaling complex protein PhoU [Mesobacillus maritimus]|uniref:Phosphate-specific transport system accessory protein PhoU n=1 Tax=Mesobacillus maritimus TaxID=1643336 RepID=A0ABS7K6S1_9BACI|nr:phosphate signaling complex protein PhoU [Mesobacillus maritimus]MBY0097977.1 phosphate signaling complex protein PhoU [Mesobacillus maritimus]